MLAGSDAEEHLSQSQCHGASFPRWVCIFTRERLVNTLYQVMKVSVHSESAKAFIVDVDLESDIFLNLLKGSTK